MTDEYKDYMLKTKGWVEQSLKEKEAWLTEKTVLNSEIDQLRRSLNTLSVISPEMLSPEDTYKLVMKIFKRSSREDIVFQLLQRNPEFIETVHSFLGIAEEVSLDFKMPTERSYGRT